MQWSMSDQVKDILNPICSCLMSYYLSYTIMHVLNFVGSRSPFFHSASKTNGTSFSPTGAKSITAWILDFRSCAFPNSPTTHFDQRSLRARITRSGDSSTGDSVTPNLRRHEREASTGSTGRKRTTTCTSSATTWLARKWRSQWLLATDQCYERKFTE